VQHRQLNTEQQLINSEGLKPQGEKEGKRRLKSIWMEGDSASKEKRGSIMARICFMSGEQRFLKARLTNNHFRALRKIQRISITVKINCKACQREYENEMTDAKDYGLRIFSKYQLKATNALSKR
jgi:hypothetical protein